MSYFKQIELGIQREFQPDRNHDKGGRSFYFFDLDDNVLHLPTTVSIFHRETKEEVKLSTARYAKFSQEIGVAGPYKNYDLIYDDRAGSFRRFRDVEGRSPFLEDLESALNFNEFRGPSWDCFFHACFNRRPVSLITARGHHPLAFKEGMRYLHEKGILPHEPNYLGVYPVSHPEVRRRLGDDTQQWSVPKLKKAAILESVENAMQVYGPNPHHRFGMSDDSPENLELIVEAMQGLKRKYPENSFFVIDTHRETYTKQEVFVDHLTLSPVDSSSQLKLFEDLSF